MPRELWPRRIAGAIEMGTESNKRIVVTMLESGSYLDPAVLTEDFTYTGVGNPDTLRGAGVPRLPTRSSRVGRSPKRSFATLMAIHRRTDPS